MGVVSRRWVWLVGVGGIYGVATGCGCKEVYRFHHTTIPTPLVSVLFLQQHPYFLFIFYVFRSCSSTFLNYILCII